MDGLQVSMLGGLSLEYEGARLAPIPSTAARSLLAFLVVNRDRSHSRERLAGIFWPDVPERRARRRLSQALWLINTVLSDAQPRMTYIQTTPNSVRFNPRAPLWVDVEEFERSVEAAGDDADRSAAVNELSRAVALYRGDLLDGFYDDWHLVDRERLRGSYFGALRRLIQLQKSNGDYEAAAGVARRLVALDPLYEPAHREMMRLLYLLGRSSEALRQFERCASILDTELGVDPEPETVRLQAEIALRRSKGEESLLPAVNAPLYAQDADIPLVARTDERATVISRFEDVLAGRGGLVFIEGHSGIGKSRLLRELADDANWRGLGVLWGQAHESRTHRPFEPLTQALTDSLTPLRAEQLAELVATPWLAAVGRLIPELTERIPELPQAPPLEDSEEPIRAREAIARVLIAIGSIHPHVLMLDDVQWADEEALATLVTLAPRLDSEHLLVCLAYRADEARERPQVWDALQRLDQVTGVERVLMSELTNEQTHELVERALGRSGVGLEFADGLFYESGGNPLFVLETLRALYDEPLGSAPGPLFDDLDTGAESEMPISRSIADAITRRIDSLIGDLRDLLEAAAVHGVVPATDVLEATAGLARSAVLRGKGELLRRGFLRDVGGHHAFAHNQIRRVAYQAMNPERRRKLHRAAGLAIEAAAPAEVEDLARHFLAAEEWPKAVANLGMAGERAAGLHAYESAASYLSMGLKHVLEAGLNDDEHRHLLSSYEDVLGVLGRSEEQARTIDAMADVATDQESRADAERRRGLLLAQTSRFKEAEQSARLAVRLSSPGRARGMARLALGQALAWAGKRAEAVPELRSAATEFADDDSLRADAHRTLGNVLSDLQRHEQARRELETALDLYEEFESRRGLAETMEILASVHMELGELKVAEKMYRRALEESQAIGFRRGEALSFLNLATLLFFKGRPDQALEAYANGAAIFDALGERRLRALALANSAAVRHTIFGDDQRAQQDANLALGFFVEVDHPSGQAQCYEILAGIAHRSGRDPEARSHLSEAFAKLAMGDHPWLEVQVRRTAALLDIGTRRFDAAMAHLQIAGRLCRESNLSGLEVSIDGVMGLLELERGNAERAVRILRDANSRIGYGVDQPYLIAYWLYRAADSAGEDAEARGALSDAHQRLVDSLRNVTPNLRARALEAVPEHRELIAAFQEVNPTVIRMPLSVSGAPTGRALRPHEVVKVAWTITHPDDAKIDDPVDRRRFRMLRLVEEALDEGAVPTVNDLASALDVSKSTVRRDIAALRTGGHLIKTRGSR